MGDPRRRCCPSPEYSLLVPRFFSACQRASLANVLATSTSDVTPIRRNISTGRIFHILVGPEILA